MLGLTLLLRVAIMATECARRLQRCQRRQCQHLQKPRKFSLGGSMRAYFEQSVTSTIYAARVRSRNLISTRTQQQRQAVTARQAGSSGTDGRRGGRDAALLGVPWPLWGACA